MQLQGSTIMCNDHNAANLTLWFSSTTPKITLCRLADYLRCTERSVLISVFTTRKRSLRRLCFYTYLSVILFTGGWGGACSQGGLLPGGVPVPRGSAPGGLPATVGVCSQGVSASGGSAPGGCLLLRRCLLLGGAWLWGGAWLGGIEETPPTWLLLRRYASCWNAFLSLNVFTEFSDKKYYILKLFKFTTSCVRDQEATTIQVRHR